MVGRDSCRVTQGNLGDRPVGIFAKKNNFKSLSLPEELSTGQGVVLSVYGLQAKS
jgi:hypothetical protein